MKKRIFHIVQSPGGVERYIQMLLKNMDTSIFENILVCSHDYVEENYKGLVTAFEHIDMIRSISLKADLKAALHVRRLIKKYKPDVVYMHSSKAGVVGRIANIGLKNKSIYNPHGWAFNMDCGAIKKNLYRWIEKILAPLVNEIIAISDFEKESAIQNNICELSKIKTIFNGVDIGDYEKKKNSFTLTGKQLGIPEDAYIIGTVGRLSKQKAPDTFIKAAAMIKKDIPNAFFMMVGDGVWQARIEELIKKLGLEGSVLITGWVNEPMEYVLLFDQAMLLSRWEGFGLVLAEYMLAGKPIIATRADAIPNLIKDGVNGLLVEIDDVKGIVEASKRLFHSPSTRNAIVKHGMSIVKSKYDNKRVVTELSSLFFNTNMVS